MFKKKMRYIFLIIIIIATMMSISYADKIAYFPPYPKDINVLITNPEIGMKLKLNDNTIEQPIEMKVDGAAVKALYDKNREMVYYRPTTPLSDGQHTVDLTINISGWTNSFSQSWNFTVSENAINNYSAITKDQQTALEYVNQFREEMGLPTMRISQALNAAANAHNNYMNNNSTITHNELPGNEGYSGGTPFIRAKAYGYNGVATAENVSSGYENQTLALQEFIAAPYHRLAWVNPYATDFGYAGQSDYHTVLFGTVSEGDDKVVYYPDNDQKEVPVTWENTETPNPIRGTYDNSIGYPITISYFSENNVTSLDVKSITLKDASKSKTEVYIKEPTEDEYLSNSIIIIPKEPLKGNTKYTVEAEFYVDFSDGSKKRRNESFSFTTVDLKTYAFNDISDHWAVENIEKLVSEGIITKDNEMSFKPDTDITRGDFCEYIVRMLTLETKAAVEGDFDDVTAVTPNARYIEAAKDNGIIYGDGDGNFRPYDSITREEIAIIMKRAYDLEKESTDVSDHTLNFSDNDKISVWAKEGVQLCNKLGIIKGRPSGVFDPEDNTTRAEAVTMITRLQNVID